MPEVLGLIFGIAVIYLGVHGLKWVFSKVEDRFNKDDLVD